VFAASAVIALVLGGCAASDDWSAPRHAVEPVGTLAPGFIDAAAPPSPEATVTPEPGTWDGVHPPAGYRVVLLTAEYDPATAQLATGVTEWAGAERVSLKRVEVAAPDGAVGGITEAMDLAPDLIIATGPALVDALALVTASHLDRQFLVVGAQVPEPTGNVTAAIWDGAASRGSEVADTADSHDETAYTSERADAAVRAGVASVLHDVTGIVLQLG
jgi:hypothetical protein